MHFVFSSLLRAPTCQVAISALHHLISLLWTWELHITQHKRTEDLDFKQQSSLTGASPSVGAAVSHSMDFLHKRKCSKIRKLVLYMKTSLNVVTFIRQLQAVSDFTHSFFSLLFFFSSSVLWYVDDMPLITASTCIPPPPLLLHISTLLLHEPDHCVPQSKNVFLTRAGNFFCLYRYVCVRVYTCVNTLGWTDRILQKMKKKKSHTTFHKLARY